MDNTTERGLRYNERARRQLEEQQRQTLLELQRQREALTLLPAEARANEARLTSPAGEPTERGSFDPLQGNQLTTTQDYTSPDYRWRLPIDQVNQDRLTGQDTEPRQMLDYAGRLPTPSSSLYTVDGLDSQYSDRAFNGQDIRSTDRQIDTVTNRRLDYRNSETERDRARVEDRQLTDVQIDMNSQMDIDRDSEKRHTDLRAKSLPIRDKDTCQSNTVKPVGETSRSGMHNVQENVHVPVEDPMAGGRKPLEQDITEVRRKPDTGYDMEEKQLMAILADFSFQERRVSEERLRRQNAEKEMERKLKALQLQYEERQKEEERKARVKALRLQAEKIQAKLWQDEEEDRKFQERMERMHMEAQKLEEQMAERDKKYHQPGTSEHIQRDIVNERKTREDEERQYREERQRMLEEELKRRETLIKKEMEERNIGNREMNI